MGEEEGIISNNQCGENLGKKKASTAVAFWGWVGPSQTKVMQIMKVSVWEKAVCVGTLFLPFLQCPFTLCGGTEELFFLSSFENQPPVEKVRWRPSFRFFPGKKGQRQPSVSPAHQHGFRIQDNRKTYSQEKGAEGRKKQEADSDFAEKVHFLLFSKLFSGGKNVKTFQPPPTRV